MQTQCSLRKNLPSSRANLSSSKGIEIANARIMKKWFLVLAFLFGVPALADRLPLEALYNQLLESQSLQEQNQIINEIVNGVFEYPPTVDSKIWKIRSLNAQHRQQLDGKKDLDFENKESRLIDSILVRSQLKKAMLIDQRKMLKSSGTQFCFESISVGVVVSLLGLITRNRNAALTGGMVAVGGCIVSQLSTERAIYIIEHQESKLEDSSYQILAHIFGVLAADFILQEKANHHSDQQILSSLSLPNG